DAEWQSCDDPVRMLYALRGRATEGKVRLWSVACCKRALCRPRPRWDRAGHLAAWRALEAAERYADGLVPGQALDEARRDALAGSRDGRCCPAAVPGPAPARAACAANPSRPSDD